MLKLAAGLLAILVAYGFGVVLIPSWLRRRRLRRRAAEKNRYR